MHFDPLDEQFVYSVQLKYDLFLCDLLRTDIFQCTNPNQRNKPVCAHVYTIVHEEA